MADFSQDQVDRLDRAAKLAIRALENYMLEDQEINLDADAGTNDLSFDAVRAGRVLVLEHLSGYNNTSSPTRIRLGYYNGHGFTWFKGTPAPIASETVEHNGRLLLRAGMYPVVRFEGCTALDDLYAMINGNTIAAMPSR